MAANPETLLAGFREMRIEDLDFVILNETRSYAFPWTRGIFVDCMMAGYDCVVATLDDGHGHQMVVGHGIVSSSAGEAHLLNVCVRRDHQGLGIGRQFVLHLMDRARERDSQIMFLEVRPSNHVAQALYESLGFVEVGRRKDYYPTDRGREDAFVLSAKLNFL